MARRRPTLKEAVQWLLSSDTEASREEIEDEARRQASFEPAQGLAAGIGCTLQNICGKVVRVDVVEGSRGLAFDRAARRAVVEASRLPLPGSRSLFGRDLVFMCPE